MSVIEDGTWMRGALHARPANLLVRVAALYEARVDVFSGDRAASARNILDLLALGADAGDRVVLRAEGEDAYEALRAVRELIERNFDQGLVPEVGSAVVPGIAIGRALLVNVPSPPRSYASSHARERRRAEAALQRARADLTELLGDLDESERLLFAPEDELLRALAPRILAGVDEGLSAEDATVSATPAVASDLVLDARARILDALTGDLALQSDAERAGDARILVARQLTPTLVARLSNQVVGLVVLDADERSAGVPVAIPSHAVLIARGRGLPLAFVPENVINTIREGARIVVDTRGATARVWVEPGDDRVENARALMAEDDMARVVRAQRAQEPLKHLPVALYANVSSLSDEIPLGAVGIGLVRTELLFVGRSRAPSVIEQAHAFARIAALARGGPVTVRLFDGGADKPIAWLPQPEPALALRGIALLLRAPDILRAELRALASLAGRADLRILVPMTEDPADIERVRELAPPDVPIGAMIESASAVRAASRIAHVADFISVGTNDLTASLSMLPRAPDGDGSPVSRPIIARPELFREVLHIVQAAHAAGKKVTVCGELAGERGAAQALVGLGVDALSLTPSRFLDVKLSLLSATLEECERAAADTMGALA